MRLVTIRRLKGKKLFKFGNIYFTAMIVVMLALLITAKTERIEASQIEASRPVAATSVSEVPAYYEVKLSATPLNGGVLSGDGIYKEGMEINLVAEAGDGYYFTGWVENGEIISADSNLSLTVTENRILKALFDVHIAANDNNESNITLNYVSGEHSYTNLGPITSYSQYKQRLYGHGQGRITQYPQTGHMAIDSVNDGPTPHKVYALSGGIIQSMGTDSYGGLYIYVRVPELNNNRFLYLHFASRNPSLYVGQTIKTGHYLGIEGSTGFATGRHTHFAVIDSTNWQIELEPWYWLNRIPNDGGYPPDDPFNAWSSKSEYLTTENVIINWNTYPNTVVYAIKITNTKTGKVVHNDNHGLNTSFTVGKLPAGDYSFYARAWQGWSGPYVDSPTRTFTVKTAPPPTGSVRVIIEPSGARDAGAQWRLTNGPDTGWKNSGSTISNLPVDSYTITYKDITGWNKPADANVSVSSNQTTSRTGAYNIEKYTLYVRSTNPTSGVTITSSTGHGGTTGNNEYQVSVSHGTSVNLTAPQYVGSGNLRKSFQGWDGTHPSSNRTVSGIMDGNKLFRAIYIDDPEPIETSTKLYGSFNDAIYRYNGSIWESQAIAHVPSLALAAHDGKLYGAFGDGIYTYDGTSWNINRITSGVASEMLSYDGKLYGSFSDATYFYDGASWTIFTWPTNALTSYQGYLYASFADAVYAYDGKDWIDTPIAHTPALAFAAHDGNLYGAFEDGIYVYDGTNWDINKITPGVASNMASHDGKLYGCFVDATYVYDGNQWTLFTWPTTALEAY